MYYQRVPWDYGRDPSQAIHLALSSSFVTMHVPHLHVFLMSFGFRPAAAHSKPATGVFGDTGWDKPDLGASQAMHFCLSKAFWTSQMLHVQTSDGTTGFAIPAAVQSKLATGVFGDTGWEDLDLGASQAMHFCLSKAFWTSQVLHVQTSDETVAILAAAPRDTLAAPFVSLESLLLT